MDLSSLTSTEVPVTWIAALVAVIVGWKTFKNVAALGIKAGGKFGYGMMAASILSILGLGGIGAGIGDLASRDEPLREVNSQGVEVDQEYVKFDGVVARLDRESKIIYPVSVSSEEDRSKWNDMSDDERKFVWNMLRSESPTLEYEGVESTLVSYEGADSFTNASTLTIKKDEPVMPLQMTYGLILASLGVVLTSGVTFFRRVRGGKFDTPVPRDYA